MPASGWSKLTWEERQERLRARDAKFQMPRCRCRYCRTQLVLRDREGHLGRCEAARRAGVTFARGAPVDEHFINEGEEACKQRQK